MSPVQKTDDAYALFDAVYHPSQDLLELPGQSHMLERSQSELMLYFFEHPQHDIDGKRLADLINHISVNSRISELRSILGDSQNLRRRTFHPLNLFTYIRSSGSDLSYRLGPYPSGLYDRDLGDIRFSTLVKTVQFSDRYSHEAPLGDLQWQILHMMYDQGGISRETVDALTDDALLFMHRLRLRVEPDATNPFYIQNITSSENRRKIIGYRLPVVDSHTGEGEL